MTDNADAELVAALERAMVAKQPPFRSAEGMLAGIVRTPSWEEFEGASRLAAHDVETGDTTSGERTM